MIKYRKFYDDDFKNTSNAGNKYEIQYELADPNGSEYDIKPTDNPKDIQEYINSFRDSCDIDLLIARFTNGDVGAIPPITSVPDADITVFPDNIHELNDRVNMADNIWSNLPNNIKDKFDSIDDFYNSIGSDKFINAFNVEENKETPEQPANAD